MTGVRALHIGVDIDEVLYPWYDQAHVLSVAAGITNGVTPTSWHPADDYGCTPQRWYDALDDTSLYTQPPISGSVDALAELVDAGHRIHLLTSRGTGGILRDTEVRRVTAAWLDHWNVPHESLTFTGDKTIVRLDYAIDDNERHVEALRRTGVGTCMQNHVTNRLADHGWRVDHVAEFAVAILVGAAESIRWHQRATHMPIENQDAL